MCLFQGCRLQLTCVPMDRRDCNLKYFRYEFKAILFISYPPHVQIIPFRTPTPAPLRLDDMSATAVHVSVNGLKHSTLARHCLVAPSKNQIKY